MMKTKQIRKTLALTLITAILGSFMNLSSLVSAQTLDKSLPQTSTSESAIKVIDTTTLQTNINKSGIVQLNDGETVRIPLIMSPSKTTVVSSANLTSAALSENGYVSFSRAGRVVSYSIVIYDFYTSITGTASVMDRNSGLSSGVYPIMYSTGTITNNGLTGHYCVLTVSGIAALLGVPVDSFYAQAGWTN